MGTTGASGGPGGCRYLITWPVKICTTGRDNTKLAVFGIAVAGTILTIKYWNNVKNFLGDLGDTVKGAFTVSGEGEAHGDLSNPLVQLALFALMSKMGIGNAWQSPIPPGGEDVSPSTGGMSTATMLGLGLAGLLAIGGIFYLMTQKKGG